MDSNIKIIGSSKIPLLISKSKISENYNPNISPTPEIELKSATNTHKPASKIPNQMTSPSPNSKIRKRKFVLAKRKLKKDRANHSAVMCQCKDKAGERSKRCVCVAYESLRASHEDFFKNGTDRDVETLKGGQIEEKVEYSGLGEMGIKRTRDRVLEEDSREKQISDLGWSSGRVKLLVKAFERLASKSENIYEKHSYEDKKGMKWALPEPEVSTSSFSPSDLLVTSESLGLNSQRSSSSIDSSQGSFTVSSRNSSSGRRSQQRKSLESSGSSKWKRKQQQKLKPTCQKPFNLKTEERGRSKEEDLMKKVKQVMEEEEKLRIPIAQGLPWTTDQPELLVKPPCKEITIPVDPKLHSDIRAVERAEFNQQVVEKINITEQYKMEKEREQKLAKEEEIRQLRKELVPKAQPMPYFDKPFVPKRSEKKPTMPREPKLNTHKGSPFVDILSTAISLNDMVQR